MTSTLKSTLRNALAAIAIAIMCIATHTACRRSADTQAPDSQQSQMKFLLDSGATYYSRHEYDKAIAIQKLALTQAEDSGTAYAIMLDIAWSYYGLCDFKTTKAYVEDVLNYYNSLPETDTAALSRRMSAEGLFADLLTYTDNTAQGAEMYAKAAKTARQLRREKEMIENMMYVYSAYLELGRTTEAIEGLQELLERCLATPKDTRTATISIALKLKQAYSEIKMDDRSQHYSKMLDTLVDISHKDYYTLCMLDKIWDYTNAKPSPATDSIVATLNELYYAPDLDIFYKHLILQALAKHYIAIAETDSALHCINRMEEIAFMEDSKSKRNEYIMCKIMLHTAQGNRDSIQHYLQQIDETAAKGLSKKDYTLYLNEISKAYRAIGDMQYAYHYKKLYDEHLKQANIDDHNKHTLHLNANYRRDTTMLNQALAIHRQQAEIDKQNSWTIIWIITAAVILIVATIILIQNHIKQIRERETEMAKQSRMLTHEIAKQTKILNSQKAELDRQNDELLTQYHFAERIQRASMPQVSEMSLPGTCGTFVLYKPRDFVSGDFYWTRRIADTQFICCGDATGHGIPGAFIAMVAITLLNDLTSNCANIDAATLLEALDTNIKKVLQGNETTRSTDSVDLTMLAYNTSTHEMHASIARNTMYIARSNGTLETIKGTKRSIGDTEAAFAANAFTNIPISAKHGDCIYLTSDGFESQIGGKFQKKLKRRLTGDIFRTTRTLQPEQQKVRLNDAIEQWRGPNEQTDDILVIGIKF